MHLSLCMGLESKFKSEFLIEGSEGCRTVRDNT